MPEVKLCRNCQHQRTSCSEKPCSACVEGSEWAEKHDCNTCCYEEKEISEKPCNNCIGGDNWLPVGLAFELGERDPLGADAHASGAKLDAGKVLAGVLADFSLALLAVAEVGTHGAEKYSRGGWQSVPDGETRYRDAFWRHLLKGGHEDFDIDSGLLHEAHQAWNVLAVLELRLRREKGK